MRIVLVAPFAVHPKGTTRWRVLPLARALASQGHAVLVVIPPYDWPSHSGLRWRDRGVEIVNAVLPQQRGLGGHALLAGRLAQAALAWRPDVVHCFKPKGHSGLVALALLAQRRVLVVVDADDYEAGWNRLLGYPAHWQALFAWQERDLLRRAHGVTAASRCLEDLAGRLGQPRRFYLPNGVEGSCSRGAMHAHQYQPAMANASSQRVLLYSRFVEHSAEQVWQVWRQVLAAEPGARLLAAGPERAGEVGRLAQLADAAGVGGSVQVLGWLPPAARPGLFAAVDAAMLPVQDAPLNRAKSPMRLLDLLAAGVPVATQHVGEYGEMVVDGVTGMLAPPGDPAALASSLVTLLRSPDLRQRLSDAARRDVRVRYAWPALASVAVAAYRAASDCRAVRLAV